jgi:hypothetical protein
MKLYKFVHLNRTAGFATYLLNSGNVKTQSPKINRCAAKAGSTREKTHYQPLGKRQETACTRTPIYGMQIRRGNRFICFVTLKQLPYEQSGLMMLGDHNV